MPNLRRDELGVHPPGDVQLNGDFLSSLGRSHLVTGSHTRVCDLRNATERWLLGYSSFRDQ